MANPRTGDLVEVDWIDSEGVSIGWRAVARYVEAVDAPQGYRSSGYWVEGATGHVILAQSIDTANHAINQCISIPRVNVGKVRVLRRADKTTKTALSA